MERRFDNTLITWKNRAQRKPILLRGARQTGKSYSVRKLGSSFESFVEVNFERNPSLCRIFEQDLDPKRISREIGSLAGTEIIPGRTLLFLDEIQACPQAVTALRYFYEDYPGLHVIGAGSLLEFQLAKISVPVGRIEFFYVPVFTYAEFLDALGQSGLREAIQQSGFDKPVPQAIHEKAISYLKQFLFIGGMPEAIRTFADTGSFVEVSRVQDDILATYRADFAKYDRRSNISNTEKVFSSLPKTIGQKVKFSKIDPDVQPRELKKALELLVKAHVVTKVKATSGSGLPLEAGSSEKKYKAIFLDVGLAQRSMGLRFADLASAKDILAIHAGATAEQFVGQELAAAFAQTEAPKLFYWHREERNASAEVDYLVALDSKIVPIEVKSSALGHLRSLHAFLEKYPNSPAGIKASQQNFQCNGKILSIPLYAVGNVERIL